MTQADVPSLSPLSEHFARDFLEHVFCDPKLGLEESHPDYLLGTVFGPAPDLNLVYSRRSGQEIQATVTQLVERFRSWNIPFLWFMSSEAAQANTSAVLEAQGLPKVDDMPIMTLDLADLNESDAQLPGFTLKRVDMEQDWIDWWTVLADAFELTPEMIEVCLAALHKSAFGPDSRAVFHLGLLDGEAVGTALTIWGDKVVGIWCIGTSSHARRRGIGAAMTTGPLLEAREAGHQQAMLGATPSGLPVYTRLGWKVQYHTPVHIFLPEGAPKHGE